MLLQSVQHAWFTFFLFLSISLALFLSVSGAVYVQFITLIFSRYFLLFMCQKFSSNFIGYYYSLYKNGQDFLDIHTHSRKIANNLNSRSNNVNPLSGNCLNENRVTDPNPSVWYRPDPILYYIRGTVLFLRKFGSRYSQFWPGYPKLYLKARLRCRIYTDPNMTL